jgi:hypothetical protein
MPDNDDDPIQGEPPCDLYEPINNDRIQPPSCNNCNNGINGQYPENC